MNNDLVVAIASQSAGVLMRKYEKMALTVEEVAKELSVDAVDVITLLEDGSIKCKNIVGKSIIPITELVRYMEMGSGETVKNIFATPLDGALASALPSSSLDKGEYIFEEDEEDMRSKGTGSVYFIDKRNIWEATYYAADEHGNKKRMYIRDKNEEAVRNRLEEILGLSVAPQAVVPQVVYPPAVVPQAVIPQTVVSQMNIPYTIVPYRIAPQTLYPPKEKHLIKDILGEIFIDKKKTNKSNSMVWYMDMAKHVEKGLGAMYIEDLTPNDIDNFMKKVEDEDGKMKSQSLCKTVRQILNHCIKKAIKCEYITKNPNEVAASKSYGKMKIPHSRFIENNIVVKLMNAVDEHPLYRVMTIIMIYGGIRIGEVLGLTWDNIDEVNKVIYVTCSAGAVYDEDENGEYINRHVEIGKTKTACSVRDVPVDDIVFYALREWKDYLKNSSMHQRALAKTGNYQLVFPDKFGKIRDYQTFRKLFASFLEARGIMGLTAHMMRHTYTSNMNEVDVDIATIAAMLGHKDIRTTQIYLKVKDKAKMAASKKLSANMDRIINQG